MSDDQWGYIIAIAILIVISGFFSASETAFTSLNRIRMKNMSASGDKRADRVLKLEENYDTLLTTILIGNNIVNIAMTSIATVFFVNLYGQYYGPGISTAVITILVLIFGEITPKSVAKEKSEGFSIFSAPLLNIVMVVLTPLNYIFAYWRKLVVKVFKIDNQQVITDDELKTIVEEAETTGSLDGERSELIQNAIHFNQLEAYDVLKPRVDVEAIEKNESKENISEIFKKTGFSRLPVYEESMDKILGVLNQKDFHNYILQEKQEISEYIAPVIFTPGTIKISTLLKRLQNAKTHIAVVIDEYGGTEGIVTMEDIIEELVGEIFDEHDEDELKEIYQVYDGKFLVQGGASVEKMFEHFDLKYEEMVVSTVNGWVVLQLDKLPEIGDTFDYEDLKIKVTKADGKRALEISIEKLQKKDEVEEEESKE